MRFGFIIPSGDIPTVLDLAQEVEAAGWDAAPFQKRENGACIRRGDAEDDA